MSLIAKIKATQLQARKNKDQVKATLLTTLIGEAEMIGKSAGNRESTDDEVLSVIRKFEKNMKENIRIYSTAETLMKKLLEVEAELEILKEFIPQKLTDLQVEKDVSNLLVALGLPKVQKSMGVIVAELKLRYLSQFDGKQVSDIFKRVIQ
jgi:uncharacterized protein YqeY